jgi:metallophosphoesterase superfamily enzyme
MLCWGKHITKSGNQEILVVDVVLCGYHHGHSNTATETHRMDLFAHCHPLFKSEVRGTAGTYSTFFVYEAGAQHRINVEDANPDLHRQQAEYV